MFEHFGPRERAFLRDMPHDKKRNAVGFGDPHELRGAFAHLPHTARGRVQRLGVDCLDRIDHYIFGLQKRFFGVVDIGLVEQEQIVGIKVQAFATQFHLRTALFGGKIQNLVIFGKVRRNLGEQRRFADARIAAHKHERAAHDAAAQHVVELGDPRRGTLVFFVCNLREGNGTRAARSERAFVLARRNGGDGFFRHRVKGSAVGAAPQPLGRGVTALRTDVLRGGFGHDCFLM